MENVIKFYKDTYGEEPPKKFTEMDATFLLEFANAYKKQCIINGVGHPLPSWYKKLDLIGMHLEALQEDIPKNLKLRSNAKLDLELIDMQLTAMRSKLKLALDELKGNCG